MSMWGVYQNCPWEGSRIWQREKPSCDGISREAVAATLQAVLKMHGPSELRQGNPVFVALYPSGMQHDLGEVTLHSAEAVPEWLTPEDRPLCYFQQLKEEAFHSQDLGVYHSVHHKMCTCSL